MKKLIFTTGILFISLVLLSAQSRGRGKVEFKKYSVEEYIKKYASMATNNMRKYGIPASIILAQGILESNYGNSVLAREANNHFGIKCHDWKGHGYYMDDDEKHECFRVYKTSQASYDDHSTFLKDRARYASLFQLNPKDYKSWAKGLQKAGYATNPSYATLLIRIIDERKLHKYDTGNPDILAIDNTSDLLKRLDNKVFTFNGIKMVYSMPGETLADVGDKYEVRLKQLLKYNELDEDQSLYKGSRIYLQPKKKKSSVRKFHIVKNTETFYSISQLEGIKIENLYKLNRMEPGQEPAVGERLCLKKTCANSPKLKTELQIKRLYKLRVKKGIDTTNDYEPPVVVKEEVKEEETTSKKVKKDSKEDLSFEEELEKQMNRSSVAVTLVDSSYNTGKTVEKEVEKEPIVEEVKPEILEVVETEVEEAKEIVVAEEEEAVTPQQGNTTVHQVAKGETLYSISKQHGVTVEQIKSWNNLKTNALSLGMKLLIGGTSRVPLEEEKDVGPKPGASGEMRIHLVQAGESLYGISKKYGVTVDQIKFWNNLKSNELSRSMRLKVGPKTASSKPPPAQEKIIVWHRVEKGETLYSMSKRFNVTVEELKTWNNLTSNALSVGKSLIVGKE